VHVGRSQVGVITSGATRSPDTCARTINPRFCRLAVYYLLGAGPPRWEVGKLGLPHHAKRIPAPRFVSAFPFLYDGPPPIPAPPLLALAALSHPPAATSPAAGGMAPAPGSDPGSLSKAAGPG